MKSEKQLYQWDTNQSLVELTPSAQYVDYPIGDEVIRLETDGTRCRIPDEVLQTYGGKTCYERYPDGTYRAYSFSVLYAPKPPDYVYTPEERTTFEALTAGAEAITTGFPELRSALAAHDYIDMDGEKVHRKIKSVKIDGGTPIYGVSVDSDANCCRIVFDNALTPEIIGSKNELVKPNIISDRLATISHAGYWDNSLRASGINVFESLQAVCFRLHGRTDIDTTEKAKEWLAETQQQFTTKSNRNSWKTSPSRNPCKNGYRWNPAERSRSGMQTKQSNWRYRMGLAGCGNLTRWSNGKIRKIVCNH